MIWKINHEGATFAFASPDGSASSRSFPLSAVLDLILAQQRGFPLKPDCLVLF
jgi:hypothetical protein